MSESTMSESVEQTQKQFPKYSILLSFSSPSGYEVKKNYPFADYICYLPLDTSNNAATFVRIVKPVMAVFVRNDIWINYLKALKERNIPVCNVPGYSGMSVAQAVFSLLLEITNHVGQHSTKIYAHSR